MKEIYAPNPKIKKPFMPTQLADVRAESNEGKANARLIAAAPDLLKALTDLIDNQDATWVAAGFTDEQIKSMPYLKPAREAIAKATGGAA